jgi:hypothetical protein
VIYDDPMPRAIAVRSRQRRTSIRTPIKQKADVNPTPADWRKLLQCGEKVRQLCFLVARRYTNCNFRQSIPLFEQP